MKRIAVLTSGGDAPGMNGAIRAVTRTAIGRGWEVFGVKNGFAGLLEETLEQLAARDVGGIIQRGGTVLGSARSAQFHERAARERVRARLAERGVQALVVIGGNGSQSGSAVLASEGFPVVGVASTIDNDLYGTDVSIGADSAINVTLEAIDRLRTTASSHRRVFIVETMGRDCGYIALMAGIAGGAEVIAIPEREVPPPEVAERLRAAYERGKTHAMVVVAEGARQGVAAMVEYFEGRQQVTGFGLRITRLGHVVRGGTPTSADRVLASRLGAAAVQSVAEGVHGVLVGDRDGGHRRPGIVISAGHVEADLAPVLNELELGGHRLSALVVDRSGPAALDVGDAVERLEDRELPEERVVEEEHDPVGKQGERSGGAVREVPDTPCEAHALADLRRENGDRQCRHRECSADRPHPSPGVDRVGDPRR